MEKTQPVHESDPTCEYLMGGIRHYLGHLHFRTCLWGADPRDVWKKIEKLDAMYRMAFLAERARVDEGLPKAGEP